MRPPGEEGPYRDDATGLAARRADLEARWRAGSAAIPDALVALYRTRCARLAAGMTHVALQLVITLYLVLRWATWVAPSVPHGEHMARSVRDAIRSAVFLGLLAIVGVVILWAVVERLGAALGARLSLGHAARAIEPPADLERLASDSPGRALAGATERLADASMRWSVAGRGAPLFVLALLAGLAHPGQTSLPDALVLPGLLLALQLLLFFGAGGGTLRPRGELVAEAVLGAVGLAAWRMGYAALGVVLLQLLALAYPLRGLALAASAERAICATGHTHEPPAARNDAPAA